MLHIVNILAKIYQHIGDTEEYYEQLGNALETTWSLTYPKEILQKEFDELREKLYLNGDEDDDEDFDTDSDEEDEEN